LAKEKIVKLEETINELEKEIKELPNLNEEEEETDSVSEI